MRTVAARSRVLADDILIIARRRASMENRLAPGEVIANQHPEIR